LGFPPGGVRRDERGPVTRLQQRLPGRQEQRHRECLHWLRVLYRPSGGGCWLGIAVSFRIQLLGVGLRFLDRVAPLSAQRHRVEVLQNGLVEARAAAVGGKLCRPGAVWSMFTTVR